MSKASRNVGIAVIIIVILVVLFLPNYANSTVTETFCSSTSTQTSTQIIAGPFGQTSSSTRTTSVGVGCYSTIAQSVYILTVLSNGNATSTSFPLKVYNSAPVSETFEIVLHLGNSSLCPLPVYQGSSCFGLGGEYIVNAQSSISIIAAPSYSLPISASGYLYLIGAGQTAYSGAKISSLMEVSW